MQVFLRRFELIAYCISTDIWHRHSWSTFRHLHMNVASSCILFIGVCASYVFTTVAAWFKRTNLFSFYSLVKDSKPTQSTAWNRKGAWSMWRSIIRRTRCSKHSLWLVSRWLYTLDILGVEKIFLFGQWKLLTTCCFHACYQQKSAFLLVLPGMIRFIFAT